MGEICPKTRNVMHKVRFISNTLLSTTAAIGLLACSSSGDTDPNGNAVDMGFTGDVSDTADSTINDEPDLPEQTSSVLIELSALSTTASFFSYQGEETTIDYFALLDDDGGVHVAFDACDQCYRAGLGYRQEGSTMVCNNCENTFAITGIGTENTGGGCWPGYLEVTVTETHVVIEPEALEAGSWYFE